MNSLLKKLWFFILCPIFILQCKSRIQYIENFEEYQIDFEECLQKKQIMNMSDFSSSIEYLQLKSPKNIIITSISDVAINGNYIGIISKGIAYLFLRNGSFLHKIGGKGKGPGEYISAKGISICLKNKSVEVFTSRAILFYDLNGKYIRSLSTGINPPIYFDDSIIWTSRNPLGLLKSKAIAFSLKMDTLAFIPNYDIFSNRNGNALVGVRSKYHKSIYKFGNNLYFKGYEDNDTIWQLSVSQPTTYAIFNMGKFKLPRDFRADYSYKNFKKKAKKYYGIPRVLEDNRYFFLTAQPRDSRQFSYVPIMFDKQEKIGYTVQRDSILGIKDDILHGPSIWPFFITEDYYVGIIEAYDLIEMINTAKLDEWQNLRCNINENSNQLLILCNKKENGDETFN